MKQEVRPLTQDDVVAAAAILREAWIEYAHNTDIVDKEFFHTSDSQAWLVRFINKGGRGFIAERDGEASGVVIFEVQNSPIYWTTRRHIIIQDIAVAAAHQRKGVGMELEKRVEVYARENGIELILGEVWAYNQASKNMMKKLGRDPLYTVYGKRIKSDS